MQRAASVHKREALSGPAASLLGRDRRAPAQPPLAAALAEKGSASSSCHVPLHTLQQRHSGPLALHPSQCLSLHRGKQAERSVAQPSGSGCCSRAAARLPRQPQRLLLPPLHHSCALGCSADRCLLAQLLVEFRLQKPWVGVILHQAVNSLLCRAEAAVGGSLDVLGNHVLGLEVYVYLKHTKRDITLEYRIQVSVMYSTTSEEVRKARSHY